jgi:hypothetical protein
MSNDLLPMYVIFIISSFNGLVIIVFVMQYCNMFCTIHIHVKKFPMFAPCSSCQEICKGLLEYLFFLHKMSLTITLCSQLNSFTCKKLLWYAFI